MAKRTNCKKLLKGRIPDLASAALVASGVGDAEAISRYLRRLDDWLKRMALFAHPEDEAVRARLIFEALWRGKPERYQPGGSFRLNEVIDAQTAEGLGPVGNCLGLTLFYNSLLERQGIAAQAAYLPHAFGRGPHVLSLLPTLQGSIAVENIFPHGFDYAGHQGVAGMIVWGNRELVAEVFAARGNELFEGDRLQEALECYRTAIRLNGRHPSAYLNLGTVLSLLGRLAEAEDVFKRATDF